MTRIQRGLTLAVALLATSCNPELPHHSEVQARDGIVHLPARDVADGDVHFYSFPTAGTRVNFLVRSDRSGRLQVHLDACFSCFRYRQGFVVEEDHIVCRACRYEYALADETWEYQGACAPIGLRSEVQGDDLILRVEDLEKAARFF